MSANLHLRGLDDSLVKTLRLAAADKKVSINKLILDLLRQSLGLSLKQERVLYHDLDKLSGTWSEQEAKAFLRDISNFENIDKEIWK